MDEKVIGRKSSVLILNNLAKSSVLREDLCDAIKEIADCIDAEQDGYDLWDADRKEFRELYNYDRSDEITKEEITRHEKLRSKYRFTPRREVFVTKTLFKDDPDDDSVFVCERCGERFPKEEAYNMKTCPCCHAEVIIKTLGQKIIEDVPDMKEADDIDAGE